jgi:hypothetical protein
MPPHTLLAGRGLGPWLSVVLCFSARAAAHVGPCHMSDLLSQRRECLQNVIDQAFTKELAESAKSVCVDGVLQPTSAVDEILLNAVDCGNAIIVDPALESLSMFEECQMDLMPGCGNGIDTRCFAPKIEARVSVTMDLPFQSLIRMRPRPLWMICTSRVGHV